MQIRTNLNQHDLFRSVIPGYVFLVVILSFFAAMNRLDDIENKTATIIAMVAGFPLGVVIQSVYRSLHIIFNEQKEMEVFEADLLRTFLTDDRCKGLMLDNLTENRQLSLLLEMTLWADTDNPMRDRLHFLISRVHSLGASVFAISLALAFVLTFKVKLWVEMGKWNDSTSIMILIWLFSIILLVRSRSNAKESFMLSVKNYILDNQHILNKTLTD